MLWRLRASSNKRLLRLILMESAEQCPWRVHGCIITMMMDMQLVPSLDGAQTGESVHVGHM